MSMTSDQEELDKKRIAMRNAGWVFAIQDLPGAYVPGPELKQGDPISRWAVSRTTIRELVSKFSEDPEVLAMFECEEE